MVNIVIGPVWNYCFGETKIGTSFVPANTPVKVTYTNNTADIKKFYGYI